PFRTLRLPPTTLTTTYLVIQAVHVRDQVLATFAGGIEQRHVNAPYRLLQLVLPLLDQMVGAEHDRPVAAITAALPGRPLGVLVNGQYAHQRFARPHLGRQNAAAGFVEHLD